MSEDDVTMTPVGQIPATGGRVRKYADGAERARAWRARQAELRTAGSANLSEESSTATGTGPELAVASLAAVLPQLKATTAKQLSEFSALAARIESAVELLSDPDAIDERLELARAESARLVAEAQDQTAAAKAEASRARAAEQAVRAERDEATESAAQAWERVGELETAATQAAAAAEQARTAHTAELDTVAQQLRQVSEDYEAALAAERVASSQAKDRAADAHEKFLTEQAARLADAHHHERQRDADAQELSRLQAEHTAALERARVTAAQHEETAVAQVREFYEARLVDRDERIEDLRSQLVDTRAARDRVQADLTSVLAHSGTPARTSGATAKTAKA